MTNLQLMTKSDLYKKEFKGHYTELPVCEVCIKSKQHKAAYPANASSRATTPPSIASHGLVQSYVGGLVRRWSLLLDCGG